MVYLAGDNNLSDEMVWALKELYRVGAPKGVAVTLQFDPQARGRNTRFLRMPASGIKIDTDGLVPILPADPLPEVNDADPGAIVDFVVRSMKEAKAEHYLLILSGHGAGILGDFLFDANVRSAGSQEQTSPALGSVFDILEERLRAEKLSRPGALIDVLGLDSCLMSMAETCSEVAGRVSYLVGSEGFDPNSGWPYFRLLERLGEDLQHKVWKPEKIAERLVSTYTMYYADFVDADLSVDIAACAVGCTQVNELEDAVAKFTQFYDTHGHDPLIQNAVLLAHWKAQSYKREQYTDLVDFFCQLENECFTGLTLKPAASPRRMLSELADISRRIIEAVRCVVKTNNVVGPEFQYSHGLSVYFPWSRRKYSEKEYSTHSAFARRTRWHVFLSQYVDGTRRPKRLRTPPADGHSKRRAPDVLESTGNRLRVRPEMAVLESPPARVVAARRPAFFVGEAIDGSAFALLGDGAAALVTDRENPPGNRENPPGNRENPPGNRENPPGNRENPPGNRENPPRNRENPHGNRFADMLSGLVDELPSTMKNPAVDSDPVFQFTKRDERTVAQFQKGGPRPR